MVRLLRRSAPFLALACVLVPAGAPPASATPPEVAKGSWYAVELAPGASTSRFELDVESRAGTLTASDVEVLLCAGEACSPLELRSTLLGVMATAPATDRSFRFRVSSTSNATGLSAFLSEVGASGTRSDSSPTLLPSRSPVTTTPIEPPRPGPVPGPAPGPVVTPGPTGPTGLLVTRRARAVRQIPPLLAPPPTSSISQLLRSPGATPPAAARLLPAPSAANSASPTLAPDAASQPSSSTSTAARATSPTPVAPEPVVLRTSRSSATTSSEASTWALPAALLVLVGSAYAVFRRRGGRS